MCIALCHVRSKYYPETPNSVYFASKLTTWFAQVKLLCCYILQVALPAQRGRTMFPVSVSSFNNTSTLERKFRFRFTAAYNSTLFCSLFLSWSSMMVVINNIYWCVAVCAVNCTVDRRICCSHCSSHRSDSQMFVDNRDFCLPPPAFDAPLGGPRRNIAIMFDVEKTKMMWLPDGEKLWKIHLFVSTGYRNAIDTQTDGQTPHECVGCACIASRGKKTEANWLRQTYESDVKKITPLKMAAGPREPELWIRHAMIQPLIFYKKLSSCK